MRNRSLCRFDSATSTAIIYSDPAICSPTSSSSTKSDERGVQSHRTTTGRQPRRRFVGGMNADYIGLSNRPTNGHHLVANIDIGKRL